MARSVFVIVSDDYALVQKARQWGESNGVTVNAYTSSQWTQGLENSSFRSQLYTEDVLPVQNEGATILPFPGVNRNVVSSQDSKVSTINELESVAIQNAIAAYRGNLTEAAKALGIGRATLYRKVKLYNIDPSQARKRTAPKAA